MKNPALHQNSMLRIFKGIGGDRLTQRYWPVMPEIILGRKDFLTDIAIWNKAVLEQKTMFVWEGFRMAPKAPQIAGGPLRYLALKKSLPPLGRQKLTIMFWKLDL